jgi:Transposase DDE domain
VLIALLKTRLPALPTWDMHDWLVSWAALALACGLPLDSTGKPCVPSPSQLCKRGPAAGAPPFETLFVLTVWRAVRCHLIGAPILAWCRADPDAATGHATAHHPRPLLHGYRVHTLLCRGSGLPVHFLVSPANCHAAPFARPLLELAVHLYAIRPRIIRLDACYGGLQLIHWIHATLGAIAVVPWNPKRATRTAPGKLGEICTGFEVKQRKSASIIGIDHSLPGKTAPHLASSIDTL